MFQEILPLIGAVPVAGPPAVLFAGPWILFAFLLAGPVALLLTFVLVLLAAGLLIVALGAIAASPYVLVRHMRARHSTSPLPASEGGARARC